MSYRRLLGIVVAVFSWSILIWRDHTLRKGKPLSRLDKTIRLVGLPIIIAFLVFILIGYLLHW